MLVAGLRSLRSNSLCVQGLPLGLAGEECLLDFIELLGDVVLVVELGLAENAYEHFLGEDMLYEHFPWISSKVMSGLITSLHIT